MCRFAPLALLPFILGCALSGAPISENPQAPLAGRFDQPQREGQAFNISGTVTLNGAVTTDPTFETAPFQVAFNGKSGDIALISVAPTALPTATNNVRMKLAGLTTTYPAQNYNTVGGTNYLPIMITKSETCILSLYNSNTESSGLFNQACRWTGSLRTVAKDDPGEPNDDDDAATFTDRSLATPLTVGNPITRLLWSRTGSRDLEDWYALTLSAGQQVRGYLATSNGTWGGWNLVSQAVDPAGVPVTSVQFSSTETGTRSWYFTASSAGTYYVHVYGNAVIHRGTSVDVQEYILNVMTNQPPTVTGITPSGAWGLTGAFVQLGVTYTGTADSFSWAFDGGVEVQGGVLTESPTVRLLGPGTYTGRVSAVNVISGLSNLYEFTFQVTQIIPSWRSVDLTCLDTYAYGSSAAVLPGNRLAVTYRTDQNRVCFAVASPGIPDAGTDFTSHYYLTGPQAEGRVSMAVINNQPVIAFHNNTYHVLNVARATTAVPTSAAQWVIKPVDAAYGGSNPSLIDLGGRIGVAHYDAPATALRFVRATTGTPTLTADWVGQVVDNSAEEGRCLSATMVAGRPAIAYSDVTGPSYSEQYIRFALANSASPSSVTDWPKYRLMSYLIPTNVTLAANGDQLCCAATDSNSTATMFRCTASVPTSIGDWGFDYLPCRIIVGEKSLRALGGRWLIAGQEFGYSALDAARADTDGFVPRDHWTTCVVTGGGMYEFTTTLEMNGVALFVAPRYPGLTLTVASGNAW